MSFLQNNRLMRDVAPVAPKRLVLGITHARRLPIRRIAIGASVALAIIAGFGGSAQAPVGLGILASAQNASTTAQQAALSDAQAQRAALEQQLADYEKQIADTQQTISQYQKQGSSLKNEIATLNAKIAKINLQIKSVSLTLTRLTSDIASTQVSINQTENRIEMHKDAISQELQSIYEADKENLLGILLANSRLSDFFGDVSKITLVQANLRTALDQIVVLRQQLLDQKQELSSEIQDTKNLQAIQQSQKVTAQSTQQQKATLLTETKGKESAYQKLLVQSQATAAMIRSRIFELLGGGELTFEKAYQYAKLAEGATGVRSAMILAILNQESLLGKNVGRCQYNQIMSGGTTAMNPKDIPTFLALLQGLNIDPSSLVAKVSCPNADGTYGGAMGPAQFIPSTWNLYASQISAVTGNTPPNPWNNSDAFVATGLYLKSYGANAQTAAAEKKAAAIYYCGTRWQRSACQYYANRAYDAAQGFQDDIDTLNGKGNG